MGRSDVEPFDVRAILQDRSAGTGDRRGASIQAPLPIQRERVTLLITVASTARTTATITEAWRHRLGLIDSQGTPTHL